MSAPSASHNCVESSAKSDSSISGWLSTIGHYLRPSGLFSRFLLPQKVFGTKRLPTWMISSVPFPKLVPISPVESDKSRFGAQHHQRRPTYDELQTELEKQIVHRKTAENALILLQREYESLRTKYVLLAELTRTSRCEESEEPQ